MSLTHAALAAHMTLYTKHQQALGQARGSAGSRMQARGNDGIGGIGGGLAGDFGLSDLARTRKHEKLRSQISKMSRAWRP